MTTSRDQLIVQAFGDALRSSGLVDDRVYECRGESISGDDIGLAAIDVMPMVAVTQPLGSNTAMLAASGVSRHDLQVSVKVYVREQNETPATRVIDPIVASAHAALMTDSALAGLARHLALSQRRWSPSEAGGQYLAVELTYTVVHATRSADLTFGI